MTPAPTPAINEPQLLRRVNALRRPNNLTNWFYLGREYLFLAFAIGTAVAFFENRAAWGLAWIWDVPVTLAAIALVGIGQHRLITLGHEASHYILFRNRWLNELASDWLCMFPLFSVTHNYRLQHLAHHQYVNEPERDPDLVFMRDSGHEYEFPMPWARFWWTVVVRPLLWVPGLVRYLGLRAKHTAAGGTGPYARTGPRSRLLVRVGVAYLVGLVAVLTALAMYGDERTLLAVPAVLLAAVVAFYLAAPDELYPRSLVRPVVSPRAWTVCRMTYATALFTGLAWLTLRTGEPWGLYYFLLWVVPLGTIFAFLMILREAIQHGGLDRGRFTHTRLFEGSTLVRWAVFPLGMDYHLPHHCFPMVPHYRLRALHRLLMDSPAYAAGVEAVSDSLVESDRRRHGWPRLPSKPAA